MKPATCSSCGAAIFWCESASTGKKMPLDATPSPEKGNVHVKNNLGTVVAKDRLEAARAAGVVLYVSHFATCKNANTHRKPKAKAAKR